MNKARTGINSSKHTNNVSKNCGGVNKAGSANSTSWGKINSSVLSTRAPSKVAVNCDETKHLFKMNIRYSY